MVGAAFLVTHRDPTRTLYASTLRQWFEWCTERGITPLTASRSHIDVWARELEELRGLKKSTVANKLGTIGGFYAFAAGEEYIDRNPAEYVKRPKVPRQSTREALTRRELFDVIEAAEQSKHTSDLLLVGMLGLCGLRVGEALALNLEDFRQQGGYLVVKVRREKGNREGIIPLPHKIRHRIEKLLRYETAGPLLRMRNGERMDRKAASRVVDRLVKVANVTGKRITPHSFRHTFITLAHDAGCLPRDIQHSMGYSDLRMVSYYDHGGDNLARHSTHAVSAHVEGA